MTREEQVREFIRNNYTVAEHHKGGLFIRFGPCELNIEIFRSLPELAQLNWGEQVFRKIAGKGDDALPEVVLQMVQEMTDEFMEKWWPVIVEREKKHPYKEPKPLAKTETYESYSCLKWSDD